MLNKRRCRDKQAYGDQATVRRPAMDRRGLTNFEPIVVKTNWIPGITKGTVTKNVLKKCIKGI
jgi:hypothetical protein